MKILKYTTKIFGKVIILLMLLNFIVFVPMSSEALTVQVEQVEQVAYRTTITELQLYNGSRIFFNRVEHSDIQVYNGSAAQNEVSIAVNPLNASNIVVGFNDLIGGRWKPSYAYSVNGGNNWTYGGALPRGTLNGSPFCDPWLAFDSEGYLYYVALSNTNNHEVFVCVGEPDSDGMVGPLGFGNPQIVAADDRSNDKPAIAVDRTNGKYKGNIYVVWARRPVGLANGYRIFFRNGTRTAGTTTITWGSAQQVSPDNFSQGAQVAVGPNGEIYIAYQNQTTASIPTANAQLFSYSTDGGNTFTEGVKVSSVTSVPWYVSGAINWSRHMSFPTLGVNQKTGTIFIAWADKRNGDDDILLSKSTDGGKSWLSSPIRVNTDTIGNGIDQWHPALTVNSLGTLHIVFYDRRDDSNNKLTMLYHASSTDSGNTFSDGAMSDAATDPDLFTPNPSHSLGDYVGITSMGSSVYVAWGDGRNANAAPKDYNSDVYFESLTEPAFIVYTTPLIAYLKWLERPIYVFEYPPTLPDPPTPWPIRISAQISPVEDFKGTVFLTAVGGYRPDGGLLDIDYNFDNSFGTPPFETTFTFTAKNAAEGINTVNILARFGNDTIILPVEFLLTSTPYILPEATMKNPGEELTLQGNGFSRNSSFEVFFNDQLLKTDWVSAEGKLNTVFEIPEELPEGLHNIVVRDSEGVQASTTLRTPVMQTEGESEKPHFDGGALLDTTMIILLLVALVIIILIAVVVFLRRR